MPRCGNFGGVGSAPAFYGMSETEAQAAELLDRTWDVGINLLDTAAFSCCPVPRTTRY